MSRGRHARIKDLDLAGKRAFIRVDFNVPIKNGVISDDTRIRASLPTISYALEQGATVILASHLGRPKGKPNPEYTLRPVADAPGGAARPAGRVRRGLHRRPAAQAAIAQAGPGGVVLLENLRFHAEEEKNDAGVRRGSWRRSPTSTSTTRSAPRIARTRRPKASSITSRRRRPAC